MPTLLEQDLAAGFDVLLEMDGVSASVLTQRGLRRSASVLFEENPEVVTVAEAQMQDFDIRVVARIADLQDIANGDQLTNDATGKVYRVMRAIPDGKGLVTLYLTEP
jgi:hypothetical protein